MDQEPGGRRRDPGGVRPIAVARRVVSALPIVLSAVALLISFLSYRLAAVRNVKPALVIAYAADSGWHVRNIGNGPALNVLVAQRHERGEWFEPVRIPPLGAGDTAYLPWLGATNVRWIGATYTDIDGRSYSSACSDDLTRVEAGHVFPRFPRWRDEEIRRSWQLHTPGR